MKNEFSRRAAWAGLCGLTIAAAAGCGKSGAANDAPNTTPNVTKAATTEAAANAATGKPGGAEPNAGAGTPANANGANNAASRTPGTALTPAQLAQFKPNETGVIPILEYHAIDNGKTTMSRSPAKFRADLERLYKEGYRPVALEAVLDNKIDVPAGTTPVVFTFDDARPTQFAYLPDGTIDPNCAVGIMQAFAAKHPDFPLKATFYVLPTAPGFGPAAERQKKMQALLKMGCEIGNHTITHPALHSLPDAKVQSELAGCVTEIHKLVPDAKVDTMALPLGSHAKNRALEAKGEAAGQAYNNRAVLLVGANPAPSPVSPKFNPLRLARIQACEGDAGITYWLDELKRHPASRYVSDGDPNTVTVPTSKQDKADAAKLQGAALKTY